MHCWCVEYFTGMPYIIIMHYIIIIIMHTPTMWFCVSLVIIGTSTLCLLGYAPSANFTPILLSIQHLLSSHYAPTLYIATIATCIKCIQRKRRKKTPFLPPDRVEHLYSGDDLRGVALSICTSYQRGFHCNLQ